MDYFSTPISQLNQATAYGEGLGSTLGQAFVQRPFQRFELAQQLAAMQQRGQLAQLANQYRMGLLGVRQSAVDQQGQARDMANQIALLRTQMEGQHWNDMSNRPINTPQGLVFPPGVGGGQPGLPSSMGLPSSLGLDTRVNPFAPQAQSGGVGLGGATTNALGQTTPQQATQLPGGWQLMQRPQPQSNPAQQMEAANAAVRNYLGMLAMTNGVPQDMSNSIVGMARTAMQLYGLGQQPQQPTNNLSRFQIQQVQ